MNNISQTEAYAILKLPIGAHKDAVDNSYKKLASHWLPDKHHSSSESVKAFSDINRSFLMLSSNNDASDMSYAEMLKQYYKVTNTKSKNKGDAENNAKNNRNKKLKNMDDNSDTKFNNTNGVISDSNNNTRNLNQGREHSTALPPLSNNNIVANNNIIANNNTINNHDYNNPLKQLQKDENNDNSEELMVASRSFAIEGNSLANQGLYSEAVQAFSKAINLNPTDFRFFGNRSFCHERENQFEEALSDANMSISLAPEWPKGYFRKAKALSGRKCYAEAEKCYLHVLSLDSTCPDAKVELALVRALQLTEMGFGRQAAQKAIQECDSVQAALDALLSNQITDTTIQDGENNDDFSNNNKEKHKEQFQKTKSKNSNLSGQPSSTSTSKQQQQSIAKRQQKQQTPLPPIPQHHYEQSQKQVLLNKQQESTKMKWVGPRNPDGLTSLWVGNVLPEVKQEHLHKMFSKYGQVQSVKSIPEKFCAFINFVDKECAGKAMQNLQSVDVLGQNLLIKFPDHPVNGEKSSNKSNQGLASNSTSVSTSNHNNTSQQFNNINGNRTTGPVNGDECYFWRTTGCQFTGVCRYKHIPGHKGVDKKPWHKSK